MIAIQSVYTCECSKCGHKWTTKTDAVPARCAKCNRVTWNDDCVSVPASSDMSRLPVSELADSWQFAKKDKPQYDDSGRVYRLQWLDKASRTVEVDADDLERVIRVCDR